MQGLVAGYAQDKNIHGSTIDDILEYGIFLLWDEKILDEHHQKWLEKYRTILNAAADWMRSHGNERNIEAWGDLARKLLSLL
jgi:hypothetical protein